VDLVFPRKPEQIAFLVSNVVSEELEELKITGFHQIYDPYDESAPQTISVAVLEKLKTSCPRLKTLVFRTCRFDLEPAAQENLPDTLETLELRRCRYSNISNYSASLLTSHSLSPTYYILFPI
jgi:hypothetical protein